MIKSMRTLAVAVGTLAAVGCGTGPEAGVAARAGEQTLATGELATWFGESDRLPLRRDVVEMWAHRWVEFALFVQRAAAGDSMLDVEMVERARWPDVYRELLARHRDRVLAGGVGVDAATLDSAYAAPDTRLLYHILIRTLPDASPEARAEARRRAEAVAGRLRAGEPWATVNEVNEDPGAKGVGGSLGLVRRGQTVASFEEPAFALAAGERSPVVETGFGYHVIWRPDLDDVREEFTAALTTSLEGEIMGRYLDDLVQERGIAVREEAPAVMRETARAPLSATADPTMLGTYDGGRFTTRDFVRWLQTLPPYVFQQVGTMTDEQLEYFATDLMLQEIQIADARRAGLTVPDSVARDMVESMRLDLRRVREELRLDSALAAGSATADRGAALDAVAKEYLFDLATRWEGGVVVPAFLADELRRTARWYVSPQGVDQALAQALQLRQERVRAAEGTGPAEGAAPAAPPPEEER